MVEDRKSLFGLAEMLYTREIRKNEFQLMYLYFTDGIQNKFLRLDNLTRKDVILVAYTWGAGNDIFIWNDHPNTISGNSIPESRTRQKQLESVPDDSTSAVHSFSKQK